jgi:predicted ATPase
MALVENRFGGQGLYILDEPEAALSPSRLLRLMCCIEDLVKRDSQFIVSTHSPILMAFPGAEVFELSEKGINAVPYQETDHFRVTKQFINAPDKMLKYLFD